jgi:signal transduction histidine kinase
MTWRRSLFAKYAIPLVVLVIGALVISGLTQIYFSSEENKAALARIQYEKAAAAAIRIEQFVSELEHDLSWIAQTPWGARGVPAQQRRLDSLRLLRQSPAITEVSHIDPTGHEQLRVSRLAMDVIGSNIDLSDDPRFVQAMTRNTYFSPIYFRKESEPYMTIAMAGATEDAGVVIAEANLKFIWDVVSNLQVGKGGNAYVVDERGRLIAHPDISVVLQKTDLSSLPQVRAAAEMPSEDTSAPVEAVIGQDLNGTDVLSAHATITPLNWTVFVDLPTSEAFAPLYASILRTVLLVLLGVAISATASLYLVRRMVSPIQILREGAARIGAGALDHRIAVRSGDELQALAEEFNGMTERLQESYAGLERKVEERTRELERSVEQLRSLSEVGQAVNSTLDLQEVLATIVKHAVELSETDGGAIFEADEETGGFRMQATYGLPQKLVEAMRVTPLNPGEGATGRAAASRAPVQIPDLQTDPEYTGALRQVSDQSGMRSLLAVPLLREGRALGSLAVSRKSTGEFPPEVIDLLQAFAAQSTLAIQNARLFREIEQKSRELEAASRHKSEFLANMSHELRTPLNAVIGFSEVLQQKMFGDLNEKQLEYVEDIHSSGRHLLSLINEILDLSKIEAGKVELDRSRFDLPTTIEGTLTLVRERATRHGLTIDLSIDERLGEIEADERKVRQILLNLLSNAVKFTPDGGQIDVAAVVIDDVAQIAVKDTGIGIAPADQESIFEEFQQVGGDHEGKREGTGLGLTLARKFVELHGGRIWVKSSVGKGANFTFTLPLFVRADDSVSHATSDETNLEGSERWTAN